MVRPTPQELITGLQRTIAMTLLPELSSPYAQTQAMSAIGNLASLEAWIDAKPAYDTAEVADLGATLKALRRIEAKHIARKGGLRKALAQGLRGLAKKTPDRQAMETAIAEFVAGVALGDLDETAARIVRGYVRRHLDRNRRLLVRELPLG